MSLIAEIIREGDTERVELCPARTTMEKIGRTVCAMLNQQGGKVLWGVSGDRDVVGVTEAEAKVGALNQLLLCDSAPRPLISVSVESYRNKNLILVEIPPGGDKPYAFQREIWIRLGAMNLRATADQSAQMVEQSASRESSWGREAVAGFELEDCDASELAKTRQDIAETGKFGMEIPNGNEELLRRLYLLSDAQLTNAAMVLFAREPLAWNPNLALRIISYGASKQGKALHEQTLQGPAIHILNQAVSIIQQETGFSSRFRTGVIRREDRPAYAPFALREGLVNAMVHRDYESLGGQLRVEIFPEHLLIQNPGDLPDGWTEQDIIRKEESHPANPDMARVFYLRGMMERLGLGGRKLRDACTNLHAKPPKWKAEAGTVSLMIFRAPRLEVAILPRQEDFLRKLKPGSTIKAEAYAKAAGVSLRQARRDLGDLCELCILERLGKGPATVYRQTGGDGHE